VGRPEVIAFSSSIGTVEATLFQSG
jgi:hypothetical protein